MRTYGLELEYFVKIAGVFAVCPLIVPHDDCGYLAEARGEPHRDARSAVHLLRVAEEKLRKQATHYGCTLVLANEADIGKELLRKCRREFGKGPSKSFFMYGKVYHNDRPRAGLHIHFGDSVTETGKDGITTTRPMPQNIPAIVRYLDLAFAKEIRDAKRVAGEYEMKPYGFEYRSLPATTDLNRLITVLEGLAY